MGEEKKRRLESQILNHILLGEFEKAKKGLKSYCKSTPHSYEDLMKASEFYLWLGSSNDALRILGPPHASEELLILSADVLKCESRLAFMLSYVGVAHLAYRTFLEIRKAFEARGITMENFFPKYFHYFASCCFNTFRYHEAAENYRLAIDFGRSLKRPPYFTKIGLADALNALGRTEEAIDCIHQVLEDLPPEETIMRGICHQVNGFYLLCAGRFDSGKESLDLSTKLFSEEVKNKDYAYLLESLAIHSIHLKDYDKARKFLFEAMEILHKKSAEPRALICIYYWLEQIPGYSSGIAEQIALRCHHVQSPYSLMAGAKFSVPDVIPNWMKDRIDRTDGDCWKICENALEPISYLDHKDGHHGHALLDLCAGINTTSVDQKPNVLPELQVRCLLAIIGSGSLGISLWALFDHVYQDERIDMNVGITRIKNLLHRLAKDFSISRSGNHLFFNFELNKQTLLIPMNLRYRGCYMYLSRKVGNFSQHDVEEILGVSRQTATRWMTDWIERGILSPLEGSSFNYFVCMAE